MQADLGRKLVFPPSITTKTQCPAISLWSNRTKQFLMVELTVPWEKRVEEAHNMKKDMYNNLWQECVDSGWQTWVLPVGIGFRGFPAQSMSNMMRVLRLVGRQRRKPYRRWYKQQWRRLDGSGWWVQTKSGNIENREIEKQHSQPTGDSAWSTLSGPPHGVSTEPNLPLEARTSWLILHPSNVFHKLWEAQLSALCNQIGVQAICNQIGVVAKIFQQTSAADFSAPFQIVRSGIVGTNNDKHDQTSEENFTNV